MNRFITPDSTLPTNPSIPITEKVEIKKKFYDDHRAELTLYESALRILREKSQGQKLPT